MTSVKICSIITWVAGSRCGNHPGGTGFPAGTVPASSERACSGSGSLAACQVPQADRQPGARRWVPFGRICLNGLSARWQTPSDRLVKRPRRKQEHVQARPPPAPGSSSCLWQTARSAGRPDILDTGFYLCDQDFAPCITAAAVDSCQPGAAERAQYRRCVSWLLYRQALQLFGAVLAQQVVRVKPALRRAPDRWHLDRRRPASTGAEMSLPARASPQSGSSRREYRQGGGRIDWSRPGQ